MIGMLLAALVTEPAAAPVLEWQAPPSCPSAAEVRELLLFYQQVPRQRPDMTSEATVTATADGWALALGDRRSRGRGDRQRWNDSSGDAGGVGPAARDRPSRMRTPRWLA
ncbi:hypothetical protein OV079_12615 [Nannocystis pusilla]|uniref:Uncharacterized protein n=1 Tax=Nannocystis pusilla TaxID=889268 RepID=A0A9X3IVK6_9BACT|nr:hypothetical protein [Nannocystis pusilla]MCY1006387.1 hypothetical protein [Nannocystis pusilla]